LNERVKRTPGVFPKVFDSKPAKAVSNDREGYSGGKID